MHNTHMSQYIPPTAMHIVTGTWTNIAGQVAGTICQHKAATAETAVVNIPIMIPSNSVGLQGAYLKSVEVDYEIQVIACTSVTGAINKVARGLDTAVAVVTAQTVTQDLVAAVAAASLEQHKLTITLTTPVWIDNDEYYLCKLTIVAAATSTVDILAAVANFTERLN